MTRTTIPNFKLFLNQNYNRSSFYNTQVLEMGQVLVLELVSPEVYFRFNN